MDAEQKASIVAEIQRIIDLETHAWNTKDAELLVSIFHPDMVWPWPPTNQSHDPITWVFTQGRYNYQRWRDGWQEIFDNYELVHNNRYTVRIEISAEGDGAFAVVDVDTLWRHKISEEDFHWKGRTCKGYTKTSAGWKFIMQTGVLDYDNNTFKKDG